MAVEAVYREPLSGRQSLLTGKLAGNSDGNYAHAKCAKAAFIAVFA